ncbi:MAG: LysR family transcriptional regulator [Clostridia bacterium]|nr:LysR family transcriptional regulator [Clostridia bacterium]
MELNKLYYFYIVAKHEHVTKAAEELHISQPALTKTIKLLEDSMGVQLFRKDKRNIKLTAFGKFLKSQLDTVFQLLNEIPDEIEKMKGIYENTVRLNVLAASGIVTEAIVEFKKKNEKVVFQVIQNEEEADCDITVTTNPESAARMSEFEKTSIITEEIYLAVPKERRYTDVVELDSFCDAGFVNLAGSRLFRNICDSFCEKAGFKPKIIFESDSIVAVKNIIGAGAGVGFWPAFSWGESSEDIQLLKIRNVDCRREIMIGFHQSERKTPICEEFFAYLTDFIEKKSKA